MSLTIGSTINIRGTAYTLRHIGPTGEGKFFGKRAFLLEDGAGNFVQGYGKTIAARSKLTEVSSDVSRALWTQRGYVFPVLPFVVTDSEGCAPGETVKTLGAFATEDAAAEYIETLPDFETGRYGLTGPSDDEDTETADDGAPTSSYGCGDESCEGCYGTEAWRLANLPAYWLAEQFRYEMCDECGQDEDGHTAERDAFGNFRAICLPSDVEVRELAAGWASDLDALQALATSGAIRPDLSDLIARNLDPAQSFDGDYPAEGSSEAEELRSIRRYAEAKGERGPVAGWSDLNY